ncbi:hypothetical protein [Brucella anthropi]|uniref:hypothetical protein n=1 Tax=Brucella anthropi TaxID=529 RepID=UPI003850EBD5
MNVVASFEEAARKQCVQLGKRIGESLAKRIMATVRLHNYGMRELDQLVEGSIDKVRRELLETGACEHDVEVICGVIYAALIEKGKEIATSWSAEGGHA